MSGGARRTAKATNHPVAAAARPPAADKRPRASDPPAKAAPKSPAKGRRAGGAASADARQDALAEARDLADAVANDDDEGINNKTPSPPPVPNKADRTVTLELNKEKAERAKFQAETERLKKQLDDLVKEKKRKESDAAEPAPPAKRAVGSGRRSVPQSAAVSRRRLSVCTSISVI
jgi:hypothetical protein